MLGSKRDPMAENLFNFFDKICPESPRGRPRKIKWEFRSKIGPVENAKKNLKFSENLLYSLIESLGGIPNISISRYLQILSKHRLQYDNWPVPTKNANHHF